MFIVQALALLLTLAALVVDAEGFVSSETLVNALADSYMQARRYQFFLGSCIHAAHTLACHIFQGLSHHHSQTVALKLRRTPLRPRGSKSHLVVAVDIDGIGFSDFLLDRCEAW